MSSLGTNCCIKGKHHPTQHVLRAPMTKVRKWMASSNLVKLLSPSWHWMHQKVGSCSSSRVHTDPAAEAGAGCWAVGMWGRMERLVADTGAVCALQRQRLQGWHLWRPLPVLIKTKPIATFLYICCKNNGRPATKLLFDSLRSSWSLFVECSVRVSSGILVTEEAVIPGAGGTC